MAYTCLFILSHRLSYIPVILRRRLTRPPRVSLGRTYFSSDCRLRQPLTTMDQHEFDEWLTSNVGEDTLHTLASSWAQDLSMPFVSPAPAVASPALSGPEHDGTTFFDEITPDNTLLGNFLPAHDGFVDSSAPQQFAQLEQPPTARQHSLPRRRSKYLLRRSGSGSQIIPIAIPGVLQQDGSPLQSLAIQRWQNSPPEDEAASLTAIYNAMERPTLSTSHNQGSDAFHTHRGGPSSTTSLESGASASSIPSNNSNNSSASQRKRRSRVAKPRGAPKGREKKMKNAADRVFKCTFCCDTFRFKYDWSRHEKSLHLSLEEWGT
jgi:hypothetical protein